MKIAFYISFPGKPMGRAREHGVSGSHTAAIGIMEHLALSCPQHEFVLCRSSIECVSERTPNLSYLDGLPPTDVDVLLMTCMDAFPRDEYPNLKHVVFVTQTYWNPTSNGDPAFLLNEMGVRVSVVYLCEWTRRHVLAQASRELRELLESDPRITKTSHVIGNPLLDDVLLDIDAIEKVHHSYAFIASWERGGDVALRAFRKIRAIVPEATFDVASYDHVSTDLSSDENVVFHSSLGKRDLSGLLARTETMLYPLSLPNNFIHKDTFGCVVSESLACGARVVTHHQGALEDLYAEWLDFVDVPEVVREQINNTELVNVPWCNSEEAIDALVQAAMRPKNRDPIEMARAVRERFSQSAIGDRWRSVVPELF